MAKARQSGPSAYKCSLFKLLISYTQEIGERLVSANTIRIGLQILGAQYTPRAQMLITTQRYASCSIHD